MEPELTPTTSCPHCGKPVAAAARFCPSCGNEIPESVEPAAVTEAAPPPLEAAVPPEAPISEAADAPEPPPAPDATIPGFSPPPPPTAAYDEPAAPMGAETLPPPPPDYPAPAQSAGYVAAPAAYPVAPVSGKRVTAGVLGILLGAWGIHRFYLGDTVGGILRIVITLFTCGIGGVIGLIEGIIYLTKTDQEFDYEYLVQRKEWF